MDTAAHIEVDGAASREGECSERRAQAVITAEPSCARRCDEAPTRPVFGKWQLKWGGSAAVSEIKTYMDAFVPNRLAAGPRRRRGEHRLSAPMAR